ncbi:MAG: hypothetical protein LBJ14_04605 [Desulfarculales bacterium]|jgi:hypothetical protein|nr:hypothetical protein [Desulfarculales bacterium]
MGPTKKCLNLGNGLIIQLGRARLHEDTTFYVRPDGDDTSHDGLEDSPSRAFATPRGALNAVAACYDLSGHTVTINIAAGTYDGDIVVKGDHFIGIYGNEPSLMLQGQGQNTVINGKIHVLRHGWLGVSDITVLGAIYTTYYGVVHLKGETTLRVSSDKSCFNASNLGTILIQGNINIDSSAVSVVFHSSWMGSIIGQSFTVNHLKALSVSAYYVVATSISFVALIGGTFIGAAVTGTRYVSNLNSVINTSYGGNNYFPGSIAGITNSGGQYV